MIGTSWTPDPFKEKVPFSVCAVMLKASAQALIFGTLGVRTHKMLKSLTHLV